MKHGGAQVQRKPYYFFEMGYSQMIVNEAGIANPRLKTPQVSLMGAGGGLTKGHTI